MGALVAIMEHAADAGWQAVESVLFAVRVVAAESRTRMRTLTKLLAASLAPADAGSLAPALAEARREWDGLQRLLSGLVGMCVCFWGEALECTSC